MMASNVRVLDREPLLAEHHAAGQAQLVDLALGAACRWAKFLIVTGNASKDKSLYLLCAEGSGAFYWNARP